MMRLCEKMNFSVRISCVTSAQAENRMFPEPPPFAAAIMKIGCFTAWLSRPKKEAPLIEITVYVAFRDKFLEMTSKYCILQTFKARKSNENQCQLSAWISKRSPNLVADVPAEVQKDSCVTGIYLTAAYRVSY